MSRVAKQSLIVAVVLIGFLASTIYHEALESMGQSYPFTTFLFRPGDRFADLTRMVAVGLDPYPRLEAGGGNAFPLAMLASWALLRLGTMTGVAVLAGTYLIASVWWCLLSMGGDSRLEKVRDACILCCFGAPPLFAVDRANLELLQFVYLATFFALHQRGKRLGAAIALGLALATKPFVLPFVGLLLIGGAFRAALVTVAVAVGVDFFALLTFDSPVTTSLRLWREHLVIYHWSYAVADTGLTFGHSLFGLIKYVYYQLDFEVRPDVRWHAVRAVAESYTYLAAAIGVGLMGFLAACRRTLFVWEKWVILLWCMTALPYVSADYTLIHYLIPLCLFLRAPSDTTDRLVALCFALLLVPKSFLHAPFNPELTEGVFINPLIQTALVLLILVKSARRHRPIHLPGAPADGAERSF